MTRILDAADRTMQWFTTLVDGGGGTRSAHPLSVQFISFSRSFGKTICQIIGRHIPSGVGTGPLENPGSATVLRRIQLSEK